MSPPIIRLAFRLLAATAVAALLWLAIAFATSAPTRISVLPSLQVDAQAYDRIALDLSTRRSLDAIPPLQPPGFVSLLAFVYTLAGHSWVAGRLALCGCLVAITVLAGVICRSVYRSEAAGWCAALLCAASPALRGYTGTLQYELVAALALLLLVWAASRVPSLTPRVHTLAAVALGLALGAAGLTREVLAAVIPVTAAYLFMRMAAPARVRRAAIVAALCSVCAISLPLGWSAAQSRRAGRTVALSDKGPLVLAFGNNPAANGTFNAPRVGVPKPSGWAFIASHPGDAAWLAGRKALYFWGILRDGWNVPRPGAVVMARALGGMVPLQWILPWSRGGWLLVVAVLALACWSRQTWREWWHIPATIGVIMAVHVVTISSYRFAVPTLPLVFVLVSGPIAHVAIVVRQRAPFRTAAILALLVVLLMQLRAWPFVYDLSAAELDGIRTTDRVDVATGDTLRFAAAAQGRRAVLLLTDEYFPAGTIAIDIRARTDGALDTPDTAVMAISLTGRDGDNICRRLVTADELDAHRLRTITTHCSLATGQPVTFAVESLAVVDLAVGPVHFAFDGER